MSYTNLIYHIIFRTRKSVEAIPIEHEDVLYRYIWGVVKEKGGVLYRVGGMPNHIHLCVQLPATLTVADFMRDLKTSASKFLNTKKELFSEFDGWGKSYCALSCSYSSKESVVEYIKKQKRHHLSCAFQDDLQEILKENGVDYNDDYFLKE